MIKTTQKLKKLKNCPFSALLLVRKFVCLKHDFLSKFSYGWHMVLSAYLYSMISHYFNVKLQYLVLFRPIKLYVLLR